MAAPDDCPRISTWFLSTAYAVLCCSLALVDSHYPLQSRPRYRHLAALSTAAGERGCGGRDFDIGSRPNQARKSRAERGKGILNKAPWPRKKYVDISWLPLGLFQRFDGVFCHYLQLHNPAAPPTPQVPKCTQSPPHSRYLGAHPCEVAVPASPFRTS